MLSCKQATEKLSADIDGELSLIERLSLRFHQFICEDCKRAAENIRALVASMKDRPPSYLGLGDISNLRQDGEFSGSESAAAQNEGQGEQQIEQEYVDRVMAALARELAMAADN